jgi:hypothetical protein
MPGKIRRQNLRLRLHIATSDVLSELRLLHVPESDFCGVSSGSSKPLSRSSPRIPRMEM